MQRCQAVLAIAELRASQPSEQSQRRLHIRPPLRLSFNSLYEGLPSRPERPPASRLWNPVNSSRRFVPPQHPPQSAAPREHLPNLPVEHACPDPRDEHPLLTLPQQRQSRQSLQSPVASPTLQRFTPEDTISGRASVALPRHRSSLQVDSQSPTPGPAMTVEQQSVDAQDQAPPAGPPYGRDLELGAEMSKLSPARVSIPGSRATSTHSATGSAHGDGDDASEFPWGPAHPCFPHPNPHVPLTSELYDTTRIIRIKRDWMTKGDLAPTFANLYPEILDPLVTEDDFRIMIKKINDTLMDAFDPFTFRAWLDAVMGVATFWLWDDVGLTGIKRNLAELERWIEDWNRDVGAPEGVKVIPLRRTGYLTLDIQIPDPHLGPDTGGSRPSTREEATNAMPPQIDYLPYPIAPALQLNSQPTILESQS
ncbi:hypothetical protein P153DRAFT_386747 [Dothidotthia symphoricarpi CBS 119687]|uniref:Ras modification protein ERF4 n=1 Tax=Dothidotthia symphoricarpi CBS 119687 TaxID=1392245 RepID=A0A6A6AC97_9PLEO|nr:uncharacterized protein P153DRAFT_386747 [Dothidotthia symphoricarpi CBS 119687]KAF2128634.1 hypothetical protein P153DRAFT_386747 [Dothidotthia symphoricarpi CBS 119687]